MDNHDKAHYGIAGVLAAAVATVGIGGYSIMPPKPPAWPVLSAQTAADVISAAANISPKRDVGVYCACTQISQALVKAGRARGITVNYEALLGGANNLEVGAPTDAEATTLKIAVEKASGGALKVADTYGKSQSYYLSFGHIAEDK
jgi:rhodanese-related sulfurtransferase